VQGFCRTARCAEPFEGPVHCHRRMDHIQHVGRKGSEPRRSFLDQAASLGFSGPHVLAVSMVESWHEGSLSGCLAGLAVSSFPVSGNELHQEHTADVTCWRICMVL
jgi:hypothetical protein